MQLASLLDHEFSMGVTMLVWQMVVLMVETKVVTKVCLLEL